MSVRNTLIAAALLALLGGVIYLEYRIETGGEPEANVERRLFDPGVGAPGTLSGIDLVRPDGTISLRLRGNDWVLTAPLEARADNDEISGLISTLTRLEVTGRLGAQVAESDLSPYGLQTPEIDVTLFGMAGAPVGHLVVGAVTPIGSGRYATADGQEGILTISSSVSRLLQASVDALRYAKIVGLDAWKIASLEIEREGVSSSLIRTDGAWRITSPIDFPADGTRVSSLLHEIAALKADSFAPPGETEVSLGVDRPALVLRIGTEDKETREIRFGAAEAAGGLWAARSDMPPIFHLAVTDMRILEIDVEALRDPRVAPLDRYGISEIRADDSGGSKVLFKDPQSNWRWGTAEGPVIGGRVVENLLDALDAAQGVSWTPARAGPLDPGRKAPGRRLRVTEGSRDPVEIEIGSEAAGRIAVRTSASRYIYQVNAPLVRRLEAAVDDIQPPAPDAAAGENTPREGESPS